MKRSPGFTLTELLIAAALLAVLAAIAVPLSLQSKARAEVARARAELRKTVSAMRAYMIDWNTVPPDNNDANASGWQRGLTFAKENPGVVADVRFLVSESFYTRAPFIRLTTPVAYLATTPLDPFSSVVPLGYDTREYPTSGSPIGYYSLFSAGPDRTEGDWYRARVGGARLYDPSNGALSPGDMVVTVPVENAQVLNAEYPPGSSYSY